ncbi:thiamin pyrophosphokinase 2, partial [Rhincodon typus]|uniref:thiamin pyrophosphokinase 2 n=1 Tax=Rhincodon typus TaxID=259920 RepID=UPI00202E0231
PPAPGSSKSVCRPFRVGGYTVGVVQPRLLPLLRAHPEVFQLTDGTPGHVGFSDHLVTFEQRSRALEDVLRHWRERELFDCLKKWRNEKYPVMSSFSDPPLLNIERSAVGLFGIKSYGVHVNGFVCHEDGTMSMWIGRRTHSKETYPGRLDNLVNHSLLPAFHYPPSPSPPSRLTAGPYESASDGQTVSWAVWPVKSSGYPFQTLTHILETKPNQTKQKQKQVQEFATLHVEGVHPAQELQDTFSPQPAPDHRLLLEIPGGGLEGRSSVFPLCTGQGEQAQWRVPPKDYISHEAPRQRNTPPEEGAKFERRPFWRLPIDHSHKLLRNKQKPLHILFQQAAICPPHPPPRAFYRETGGHSAPPPACYTATGGRNRLQNEGKPDLGSWGREGGPGNVRSWYRPDPLHRCCLVPCFNDSSLSLPPQWGNGSYTYEDEAGVFPECQFVYDLEVPAGFEPTVGDGEVLEFYLWPLDQVRETLAGPEFKPNCAMVALDFLIRRGILHADNERHYHQFVEGLHREL